VTFNIGVLVVTVGTIEGAIEAMTKGAHDYLATPCSGIELELVVDRALEHQALLARAQASEAISQ